MSFKYCYDYIKPKESLFTNRIFKMQIKLYLNSGVFPSLWSFCMSKVMNRKMLQMNMKRENYLARALAKTFGWSLEVILKCRNVRKPYSVKKVTWLTSKTNFKREKKYKAYKKYRTYFAIFQQFSNKQMSLFRQ